MAILKCKMCGGDLNLVEGASTAECEYCGSVQTVPKVDEEKKLTLFARANRLRAACDFDKASGVYEAIVADFPEEAEAYWVGCCANTASSTWMTLPPAKRSHLPPFRFRQRYEGRKRGTGPGICRRCRKKNLPGRG